MVQDTNKLYQVSPIKEVGGIPVFSMRDRYIENYARISADHVKSMQPGKDNPFIENDLWVTLENSTRNLIKKHVPSGSRILDVGVGLGRLMAPLDEYERFGIDISFDYLEKARENGINVAFSKIENLPYKDGCFDAVVACDVLEHVLDLNECSRNILRILRPGGILIVRVPLKEDLDVYLKDDLPYELIHLRSFDEASLRLHFEKIFFLQFIEALGVAPFLQGHPRFKLRLLPEETRSRINSLSKTKRTLSFLKDVTKISADNFMNWIYELRDKHHSEYMEIVDDLVMCIEINAVFRKNKD